MHARRNAVKWIVRKKGSPEFLATERFLEG